MSAYDFASMVAAAGTRNDPAGRATNAAASGLRRRLFIGVGAALLTTSASAQSKPTAVERLNELGPENAAIARRGGLWDVTETFWASPGAQPVESTGLVAERRMLGSLLQEFIRPPSDQAQDNIKRTDLLSYNRLEGRWDYVSFDTRIAAGLMSAWSTGRGDGGSIDLTFMPFALVGFGSEITGQLLRMEQLIRYEDDTHDVKDQYFTLADGNANRWLAHRYAYRRRG